MIMSTDNVVGAISLGKPKKHGNVNWGRDYMGEQVTGAICLGTQRPSVVTNLPISLACPCFFITRRSAAHQIRLEKTPTMTKTFLIDRRHFGLASASVVLSATSVVNAQTKGRMAKIGVLGISGTTQSMIGREPEAPVVRAFIGGLRELNWVYRKDFTIEARGGAGMADRYVPLAAELVARSGQMSLSRRGPGFPRSN